MSSFYFFWSADSSQTKTFIIIKDIFLYIYFNLREGYVWHFTWKQWKKIYQVPNFLSYHSCYVYIQVCITLFYFFITMQHFSLRNGGFFFSLSEQYDLQLLPSFSDDILPLWRPPFSLVVQTAVDILPLEWFPLLLNELLSWHYSAEVIWLFPSVALLSLLLLVRDARLEGFICIFFNVF